MNVKNQRLLSIIKSVQKKFTNDYIVIPIPNIISKAYTTFCSMREDLLMMKQYTLHLEKETNATIKSSLTYSIISLYGKCFMDASKSKFPKLEESDLFKNESKILETHNKIMELRHRFIAHRGDTESEVSAAFMLIPKENNSRVNIKFRSLKQISFSTEELIEIRALIKFILLKLDSKINKAAEKAKKGLLENLTPEQLAAINLNNTK